MIEILKNLSLEWVDILENVRIKEDVFKGGYKVKQFNLSLAKQYPSCKVVDLDDYFDMKKITPLMIFFTFKRVENLGVTLKVEEKNRSLRSLKSSRLMYTGPILSVPDLSKPIRNTVDAKDLP